MRKLLIGALALGLLACDSNTETKEGKETDATAKSYMLFGEQISADGAISTSELIEKMKGGDTIEVKVTGMIDGVCQRKGCWMDIKTEGSENFSVKFKDYSFFVPKDATGKETIFEGKAYIDTISVEEQIHYAEDAGGDRDSLVKVITEPQINIGFMAKGVLIEKYEMMKEDNEEEEEGESNEEEASEVEEGSEDEK